LHQGAAGHALQRALSASRSATHRASLAESFPTEPATLHRGGVRSKTIYLLSIPTCVATMRDMTRRLLLSAIWAYAALVWGSISHTFLATPDIGPGIAPILFVAIVLLPLAQHRWAQAPATSSIWSRVRWSFQRTPTTEA
jgi:hypothetical protein